MQKRIGKFISTQSEPTRFACATFSVCDNHRRSRDKLPFVLFCTCGAIKKVREDFVPDFHGLVTGRLSPCASLRALLLCNDCETARVSSAVRRFDKWKSFWNFQSLAFVCLQRKCEPPNFTELSRMRTHLQNLISADVHQINILTFAISRFSWIFVDLRHFVIILLLSFRNENKLAKQLVNFLNLSKFHLTFFWKPVLIYFNFSKKFLSWTV